MAEAEEEQCRADRFWGLDREDWEQRRAARGMYAEDVAAWRLREARKVAARQAVWEAEDREGRAALAAELGRHERRARAFYLRFFYSGGAGASSEAVAHYLWPSRPKVRPEDVVTREDYHLPAPAAPTARGGGGGRRGGGGGGGPASVGTSGPQVFHTGAAPHRRTLLQDTGGAGSVRGLLTGGGGGSVVARRRPGSRGGTATAAAGPEEDEEEDHRAAAAAAGSWAGSGLGGGGGGGEGGRGPPRLSPLKGRGKDAAVGGTARREKPPRLPQDQPLLLMKQNNQISASNLEPRPFSRDSEEEIEDLRGVSSGDLILTEHHAAAAAALDRAPLPVRPHTVVAPPPGRPAPEQGAAAAAASSAAAAAAAAEGGGAKPAPFRLLHVVQRPFVLPDEEADFLTRSFEILDVQGRGYITEDELMFGVQENARAREQLKQTIFWPIIKKRAWRVFEEMFAPLGNVDLQIYLEFARRIKVQRNVSVKYIRPASETPLSRGLIPWSFKVGARVDFLAWRGAAWVRGRVLACNGDGTYDLEAVPASLDSTIDMGAAGDPARRVESPQGRHAVPRRRASGGGGGGALGAEDDDTESSLDLGSLSSKDTPDIEAEEEQVLFSIFEDAANDEGVLTPEGLVEIIQENERELRKVPCFFAMLNHPVLFQSLMNMISNSGSSGLNEIEFVEACLAITEIARLNDLFDL